MTTPGGLIATLISARSAIAQAVDALFNKVSLLLNGENSPFSATTNTNSGNIFDASVNGYQLTPTGTTSTGNFSPYNINDWSVYFSGGSTSTAPYISGASTSVTNFGTSDFTVEVWIYPTGVGNGTYGSTILDTRAANTANTSVMNFGLTTTNQLTISNLNTALYTSPTALPYNTWTHVAISRWGTGTNQTAVFVNGQPYAYYTDSTTYGQAGFYIGTSANSLNLAPYVGNLSNFRIVKGVSLYQSAFVPPTATLTAVPGTTFLGLTSQSMKDFGPLGVALTPVNSTVVDNFGPYNNYQSIVNYSQSFNGSTDTVQFTPSVSATLGSGDYTVECWVNLSSSTGSTFGQQVVGSYNGSSAGWDLIVNRTNATQGVAFWNNNSSIAGGGAYLQVNTWYHIAVVRKGTGTGNVTIYLNGVSLATGTDANNDTYITNGIYIGSQANNGSAQNFPGLISNVRVVKGTAVYNGSFTPSTTPLTAISGTILLACNGSTIADSGPLGLGVTSVLGTPKIISMSPFDSRFNKGAAKFDAAATSYTVSANSNLELAGNDFTIEFWWYPTSTARQWIYSSNTDYWIGIDYNSSSNGVLGAWASSNGTSWDMLTADPAGNGISTGTPVQNSWNHIALSRSSTTWSMFLNGKRVLNKTVSGSIINKSAQTKNIGKHATAGYYTSGAISNFRVVNGTAVYDPAQATITVPTASLTAVANTALLTLQSNGAVDASTNNISILPVGAPYQTGFDPFYTSGTSVRFNGSTDYVTIPSSSALQVGSNDFTFEGWFNLQTLPATGGISTGIALFQKGRTGTSNLEWGIYVVNNSGVYSFILQRSVDGTTIDALTSNSFALTANTWFHVAVSKYTSGIGTVNWFVNGIFNKTSTFSTGTTIFSGTGAASIAANNAGAAPLLNGMLSNFRLVNGTSLYTSTSNFTPSTTPLTAVANTALLICQGNQLVDNSVNAATLTAVGTPIISQANPFFIGNTATTATTTRIGSYNAVAPATTPIPQGAMYFNGSSYYTLPANTGYAIGTNSFTFEAWVYPTVNAAQSIFGTGAGTSTNPYFYINGLTPTLYYNSAAQATGPTVTLNAWNHLAFVRNGTTVTIYTNGVGGTPVTLNTTLTQSAPLIAAATGGTQIFTGYMSDLRLVNGTAVYTGNFTPSTTPLTAIPNTKLLTMQSYGAIDASSSPVIMTKTGAPVQTYLSPAGTVKSSSGNITGATRFNGTDYYLTPSTSAFILTGDFTFETWLYPTSNPANGPGTIIDARQTGTGIPWDIRVLNNLTVTFYNGTTETPSTGKVQMNAWNHLAVVRSGTTITFWINGANAGSFTQSGSLGSAAQVVLGTNRTAGYGWYGYLWNMRMVTGTAVYTSSFTPSTNLTAISGTQLLTFQEQGAYDVSPNLFALSKNGTPSQTAITPVSTNWAHSFNGTTDYYTLPASSAYNFGSSDFTIEMWAYFNSLSAYQVLIQQAASASSYWNFTIGDGASLGAVFSYNSGAGEVRVVNEGTQAAWTLNTWHHIALVRSGTTVTVYRDGVSIASGTLSGALFNPSAVITVGAALTTPNLNGYISNLRVVNGTAVYTGNFTPPTTSLTAITNTVLLTAQNNKFVDNSSTAAAFTIAGSPKVVQYSPFSSSTSTVGLNSGSYYFDGASYMSTGYQTDAFKFPANFTIEAWIYPTAVATYKVIYDSRISATSTAGIGVFLNASSQLVVYANNTAGIAAGTVPLNAWSHIAVVRSGSTITAYLNGVSVGTVANSASQTDGNCVIGSANVAGNYFSGYISNLSISNVSAKYITNFVPVGQPAAPSVTTSLLLSGTGSTAIDASAKADMTFVGNAQIVNGNSKYGTGSLLLPGSSYVSVVARPELLLGVGNFTVEFWWRANTAVTQTNYAAVFSNNFTTGTPASGSWSLKIRTTGDNVQFSYSNGAALTNIDAAATINVNDGSWHHIALVRSGTSMYIFIDGTLQTSGSTIGATQPIGVLGVNTFIGYQPRDGAYVNGWIDDLRITAGNARYTSNFTPPTTLLPTN
jgi:hypothetical protein